MDFGELATFPMEDDDWLVKTLIGGVLVFLGFLFVPVLAVWGYAVETMRGAVAGETGPPEFDDWGALIVDGLKAWVVLLVYQIIPAVVGIALFVVFGLAGAGTDSAGLGFLGFFLGLAVWTLLSLVFGYFAMVGVVNFAVEGSLGAAFDVGTVRSVALSSDYLMAWVFYIAISIVMSVVGSLIVTYPFAAFYGLVATSRAFGEAYASVTGTQRVAATA